MQSSSGTNINQTFGNTEVTHGSHSFQGIVKGDLHLHSNDSGPNNPQSDIFDNLPQAAFNDDRAYAPDCLPGTRKALLAQIRAWANGDETQRAFWLEGMAGTGKTTIALTVAREQNDNHRLGASFFFSRGGGGLASARSFPTTIAAQLKEFSPDLERLINDAAAANPRIRSLMLYEQWKKLVIEPLSNLRERSFPHPLLIVIDALDECDDGASFGETAFSTLIQCLKDVTTIERVEVRVFITSRPDGAIKLGFERILNRSFQGFILQNVEKWIVDEDLTLLYKTKLEEAAIELNRPDLMCSDDAIEHLVQRSHGLFIHAVLVCRHIRAGGAIAHQRLSSLLLTTENNIVWAETELDKLYNTVLESSFATILDPEVTLAEQSLFRRIVGSVVILFDVMTISDLAMMLGETTEQVLTVLSRQRSVINVGASNIPIQLLHPSFRDYILDPTRCLQPRFLIDPKEAHGRIFRCCMQVMKDHLRRNMCARSSHPAENPRYHISKSEMERMIPTAVQYASCYWIHHLSQSTIEPLEGSAEVLEFFQFRFLYWLEALSLVGRVSEGALMMDSLIKIMSRVPSTTRHQSLRSWMTEKLPDKFKMSRKPRNDTQIPLHAVLRDARRFLRTHMFIIENSPLQLYSSAIIFSPTSSLTRQRYGHELSGWKLSSPSLFEAWAQHLQRFDCPTKVKALAFSQDGCLVAAGLLNGDVYFWETSTLTEIKVLRIGRIGYEIVSMAFSPDDSLIAVGYSFEEISIWDLTTLGNLRRLKPDGRVLEVAFSRNGNPVASCLPGICIWDIGTGAKLHTLEHQDPEQLGRWIKLSTDCTSTIEFCNKGKLIEVRDIMTGTIGRSLKCRSFPCHPRCAVQVSADGNLVAFEIPHTFVLLNIATGKTRLGETRATRYVEQFAFSCDSKLLAVEDISSIAIYDIASWKMVENLETPDQWMTHVSFSPSSCNILVCASGNSTSMTGSIFLVDITGFSKLEERRISETQTRRKYRGGTLPQASSANGIAFQSYNSGICFWDPKADRFHVISDPRISESSGIPILAVSADGEVAASTSGHGFYGEVCIWDTRKGALKHVLTGLGQVPSGSGMDIPTNRYFALSANGKLLATATLPGMLVIWDTTTGTRQNELFFPEQEKNRCDAMKIEFSYDGKLVACGFGDDSNACLWEIGNTSMAYPKTEFSLRDEVGFISTQVATQALAFSPDGMFLVSGFYSGELRLWDTTTGTKQWVLKRYSGYGPVAFSPNGELIACASNDRSVILLDSKSGIVQRTFTTNVEVHVLFFSTTGLLTNRGFLPLLCDNSRAIFVSDDWIMVGGERTVYIHPDYQRSIAFVSGDVIGLFDDLDNLQTLRYIRP